MNIYICIDICMYNYLFVLLFVCLCSHSIISSVATNHAFQAMDMDEEAEDDLRELDRIFLKIDQDPQPELKGLQWCRDPKVGNFKTTTGI